MPLCIKHSKLYLSKQCLLVVAALVLAYANVPKVIYLHIGFHITLSTNDRPITIVHSFKDGGTIVNKLTFREHINSISVSAHRLCAITFRTFSKRKPDFAAKVFSIYMRSKLEYASTIRCPQTKGNIATLERVLQLSTKRISELKIKALHV